MRKKFYNVYKFNELTDNQKEKAIEKWYKIEDYPFLSDDLTENCRHLLEKNITCVKGKKRGNKFPMFGLIFQS